MTVTSRSWRPRSVPLVLKNVLKGPVDKIIGSIPILANVFAVSLRLFSLAGAALTTSDVLGDFERGGLTKVRAARLKRGMEYVGQQ